MLVADARGASIPVVGTAADRPGPRSIVETIRVNWCPVDPFAVIMIGIIGGMLVGLVLLGLLHPRSGAQTLDWKPTRAAEQELQNEIDDLDQMLEAANVRRRQRGAPELTEEGVRATVGSDIADTSKRREEHLAEVEVVQMLGAKNARRRTRGLPEISVEEYRAKILGRAGQSRSGDEDRA